MEPQKLGGIALVIDGTVPIHWVEEGVRQVDLNMIKGRAVGFPASLEFGDLSSTGQKLVKDFFVGEALRFEDLG